MTQTQAKVTGLHHLGVPVRSMEATIAWYRDVLGVEPRFVQQAEEGPGLDSATQLDGTRLRYAFVDLGNTSLEFIEYQSPIGADNDRRNCDVGAIHVCFEVDDIRATYEQLLEKGVVFNGPPNLIETGPIAGCWFCYFRDPDGIQLEIFQTP
jgi:catechol 2,3-dioxygenase-like lactoylglutathione lyase family enzyme